MELISNQCGDTTVVDGITRLFDEDGTIYLVTGYFTNSAYRLIRPDIERFLSRSPENELVVVVSPTADQFTPSIARDLQQLDDRIQLYKYPHGCLHAKLYVRTGDHPTAMVGSINLTRVAFEQNIELSVLVESDDGDADIEPFVEWTDELLSICEPFRKRDLFRPVMLLNTISVWTNKARLLSGRTVVHQPSVYVVLALLGLFVLMSWTT
ncbi:phospholipase D-like domain-containing protein [Natronorubrum texcoconense]|uniref:PLD-like domain-containing protein n=1 Tax=Natronorubrum texcoconense TaxID=1095776 RepID=A0A1G8UKA0_9EURY|nr:phospholipase D-like domain-containing protein [Natronorubrum texcoconense]SDJ54306.1 PLD-like domain-containing protein [Natronorubrum texcoconense]